MALELSDVRHIAHLARIEVSEDKAARTLTQPSQFFSLVKQMQAVDTIGIEPMAHPIEQAQAQAQRLRDDAVTEANRRADYQQCAPATEAGLYLMPKVIEQPAVIHVNDAPTFVLGPLHSTSPAAAGSPPERIR